MNVSIIVIFATYYPEKVQRLLDSMVPLLPEFNAEVLLIQEEGFTTPAKPLPPRIKHFTIPAKQGIPFNRNQGIQRAKGDVIIFIDDDCWVQPNWLRALLRPLRHDKKIPVVTSGTRIPSSTFLGNCISALGFPGGGSLGFEKVWTVTDDGFTTHLAAGNCALRRSVFSKVGVFDEKMKWGAEDAEFSLRLERAGIPIKYAPDAFAYHEARTSLSSFINWQLRRGKANYHFKQVTGNVGSFLKLRLWSTRNIVLANLTKPHLPFIFALLFMSATLQQIGYLREKRAFAKRHDP